jgi:cyclin T
MHRFYAFHSFTHFHRNSIAAAALFLAAKVEEQPRKLEHVIKVANICLNIEPTDPSRESYAEQAQDLVFNENVLLQTLGFDVAIDHPHTHVVKTCHLVKGELFSKKDDSHLLRGNMCKSDCFIYSLSTLCTGD